MMRPLVATILFVTVAGLIPENTRAQEWRTDFTRATVDGSEIVSGGVPKDGIPAIDTPHFVDATTASTWLTDRDPVAVVSMGGVHRAYPLQILLYHEIANDVVDDVPVVVTYCPLCNTTIAFLRAFEDEILDFGTTGLLRHSDLIMYDRQTETWWQQATGEAIVGTHAGKSLTFVPSPVIAWADVVRDYPSVQVLSRDTGFDRRYGQSPYPSYDQRPRPIEGFFLGKRDTRVPMMERVIGVEEAGDAIAIPFSLSRSAQAIHIRVNDRPLVAFWASGTASPVNHQWMDASQDVGATGVFRAERNGRPLTFRRADPADLPQGLAGGDGRTLFTDLQTGSHWSISGLAVAGPAKGERLEPVQHSNPFWFAWAAFFPDTRLVLEVEPSNR